MPPARSTKPLSPDHAALGRALEAVMAEKGVKQEALAATLDMDIKQLGSYVRGQGNPTYTTILRISRALEIEAGRLIAIADELRRQG